MKKVVFVALYIFLSFSVLASSAEQLIKKANDFYAKKQYDNALIVYLQVLDQGLEAPELYYNIGNVYFRKGEIAKAILFYERAYRLDPTNDKIKYNLDFANQFVQDKFEQVPEFFLKRWWHTLALLLSANVWAIVSLIFFLLLLVSIYIFLFAKQLIYRKIAFSLGFVFLLISVFAFSFAKTNYNYYTKSNEAIIMYTSSVRSSPSDDGTELYILHQGVKVKVISISDGWYEVRLPNGSIGWIKREKLEKI